MALRNTQPKDRTGLRYGRLVVLSEGERRAGLRTWNVRCDCGSVKNVTGTQLAGRTRSCGCLRLELVRAKTTLPHVLFVREKLKNYKSSAKRRGIAFELTPDAFESLLLAECECCGLVGGNTYRSPHSFEPVVVSYNGIDRIDNDRGYVNGNVRTYCRICNEAKRSKTENEWQAWLKRIGERYGS